MPASAYAHGFGPMLREWRLTRRLTQQALAELAEISTRHLSFLENGRAQASREMALVLGNALDLSLRERNMLLAAAGFAPVYRETPLDAAPMQHVRMAIDRMLAQQEPYPALVMDRAWNVLRMNEGCTRLFARLLAGRTLAGEDSRRSKVAAGEILGNLGHALFHPEGLRAVVVDWPELAAVMLERLHREAAIDPQLRALLDALLDYEGVAELPKSSLAAVPPVAIPVHLRAPDGGEARLFTMLTTLGTPLDVTAQELRVELYFPLDAASEAFLRSC